MNDIKMTGFDLETFDRIKKNISDLLPSSPNDDDTTKSPTNVELYNQIYGNRDISDGAKGNKISALRRGDGISLNDIIKIAAWKGLSLDWLILGEGNPPPELQEAQEKKEEFTVKSFMQHVNELAKAPSLKKINIEVSVPPNRAINSGEGSFKLEAFFPKSKFRVAIELLDAMQRFSTALNLPACPEKKIMIDNTLHGLQDIKLASRKEFGEFCFSFHHWHGDIDDAYEHYENNHDLADAPELEVPPLPDGYR